MELNIAFKKINELSIQEKKEMFTLMEIYYENLTFDKFDSDFSTKDEVILLLDDQSIYGFTTIELLELNVDNQLVLGVFSGNTIVDEKYSFQFDLQQSFSKYIKQLIEKENERQVFWFLICKGYKTYRYLSIYFNNYYPNKDYETPRYEQKIMNEYAKIKYKEAYNAETGIIKNSGNNDFLKEGVAPMDARILKKSVNAFFAKKNPGHGNGDELVCLARFSNENMKEAFFRVTNRY